MRIDFGSWWRIISRRQDAKGAAKHSGDYNPVTDPRDCLEQAMEETYDLEAYLKYERFFLAHVSRLMDRVSLPPAQREDFNSLMYAWLKEVQNAEIEAGAMFGRLVNIWNHRERALEIAGQSHKLPMLQARHESPDA